MRNTIATPMTRSAADASRLAPRTPTANRPNGAAPAKHEIVPERYNFVTLKFAAVWPARTTYTAVAIAQHMSPSTRRRKAADQMKPIGRKLRELLSRFASWYSRMVARVLNGQTENPRWLASRQLRSLTTLAVAMAALLVLPLGAASAQTDSPTFAVSPLGDDSFELGGHSGLASTNLVDVARLPVFHGSLTWNGSGNLPAGTAIDMFVPGPRRVFERRTQPVFAMAEGTVVHICEHRFTADGDTRDSYVIIDHPGYGQVGYVHLDFDDIDVSVGDEVSAGDQLGWLFTRSSPMQGNCGSGTSHHLHLVTRAAEPVTIAGVRFQNSMKKFESFSFMSTTPVEGSPLDPSGSPLASGDFNGDGIDDLAVGVPGESLGDIQNAGAVHIFYGQAGSNLNGAREHSLNQKQIPVSGVAETGDVFGSTLASGDFNGDGIDDLAVGAPGESLGDRENAGALHIFNGRTGTDLNGTNEYSLNQKQIPVSGVAEAGDRFAGNVTTN